MEMLKSLKLHKTSYQQLESSEHGTVKKVLKEAFSDENQAPTSKETKKAWLKDLSEYNKLNKTILVKRHSNVQSESRKMPEDFDNLNGENPASSLCSTSSSNSKMKSNSIKRVSFCKKPLVFTFLAKNPIVTKAAFNNKSNVPPVEGSTGTPNLKSSLSASKSLLLPPSGTEEVTAKRVKIYPSFMTPVNNGSRKRNVCMLRQSARNKTECAKYQELQAASIRARKEKNTLETFCKTSVDRESECNSRITKSAESFAPLRSRVERYSSLF